MKKKISAGTASPFASMKIQERKVRQEHIIQAAERVFANKPFNQVSIRDIAREAGISHAAIYRYFPDQQTLFVEAFIRGGEKIISFFGDLIDNNEKVSIEAITDQFITYLIEDDQYFRMMTHFMLDGSLNAKLLKRLNTTERLLLDQLEKLFAKLNVKGDKRMLSHAFFASMNGVLITFRNYPGRSKKDVALHMRKIGKIIASKFKD
ncbi:MAG: TetR/AcrR family transcriptional regulator [Spirochaetes bacterium]|nr:TetR/AcrR family transcriptional regulator [Spirochaetota bacterium]